MDPQQTAPLSQPVTPVPVYTPPVAAQPSPQPASKKRLYLIIASVIVALLVILGGVAWWQNEEAKKAYPTAAAAYKANVKKARDAMNTELDQKNISPSSSPDAPPIFETYGKEIQAIVARAPQAPKLLGVIPADVDKKAVQEVADITKKATDYANGLRYYFTLFQYYTDVTTKFKPVRDLGTITVLSPEKVKKFGEQWPIFLEGFKKVTPPKELEGLHADMLAQATVLAEKIKQLTDTYDSNSDATNDKLLGELNPLTKKFNETFVKGLSEVLDKNYESVNKSYDALDALLK